MQTLWTKSLPVICKGDLADSWAFPACAWNTPQDEAKAETLMYVEPSQASIAFRGDIINGSDFTAAARVPDPFRMLRAYNQSAATLNLLRGFSTGAFESCIADLSRLCS